jgi:hypothetical protein
MESLVTLALAGNKCIKNRFEKFENFQQFFKKVGEKSPTLSRACGPVLTLPWT